MAAAQVVDQARRAHPESSRHQHGAFDTFDRLQVLSVDNLQVLES